MANVKMKNMDLYINQLKKVLDEINIVEKQIDDGIERRWTKGQIKHIVKPEIEKLYQSAILGDVYYKYGKKQRMLESTYCLTENCTGLNNTNLGKQISALQDIYNHL